MAQDSEDGKGLKLEKNEPKFSCLHGHDIFQKSPKFQVDSFSGKIHLIFSLSAKF